MVDPDDGGCYWGTRLPPPAAFIPTPIRDLIREPLDEEAQPRLFNGRPCLLYPDWDYGEDWSGKYVRDVHPFCLTCQPKLTLSEFWTLVELLQRGHGHVVQ